MSQTDALGRPVLSSSLRSAIDDSLKTIPDGKRGALVVIADQDGTRAHLAAKIGEHWRVAGGGGVTWAEKKPYGYVGVEAVW